MKDKTKRSSALSKIEITQSSALPHVKTFCFLLSATVIIIAIVFFYYLKFNDNHKDPLTIQERTWLKAHDGKIRLAPTPHWAPMEFIDEKGRYQGLVADYIRLIEQNLGFKFQLVKVASWNEAVEKAKKRELDVYASAMETPSRLEYMDFTTPYFNLPYTIISRKSVKDKLTLQQMKGMRIAVAQGYAVNDYLKNNYPGITIVNVQDELIGLKMVSFKEVDAMVAALPYALHGIEKAQITNLRIVGVTDHVSAEAIGTRNDWPLLHSIMEKGLAQITDKQRRAIRKKWIRLEPNKLYYNKAFWYVAISIFVMVFIISLFTLAWNRALKIKVNQRTEALGFNEMRLKALVSLNEMRESTIDEIIEYAFKEAVRLTKSQFGYLAFSYNNGNDFQSILSYENKKLYHRETIGFPLDSKGLWGDALKFGKPIISNCYENSNPLKKGIPPGHTDIVRYMNVPIFENDKIVAIAGVGNKKETYNNSDVRQLQLLTEGMWRIIQRRHSEESIKNSEQQFRDLVEFSLTGITIIQNNKCVYYSPEYKRIFGSLYRIFENRNSKNIHPDDAKDFQDYHDSTITGNERAMDLSFRFYSHLDKTSKSKEDIKWVYCRTHLINFQGMESLMVNVIDVTHIKKLEHLLHVQDKMASLGHVTAGIAHEIRNPLSGINIYIKALENIHSQTQAPEQLQEIIEELTAASGKIESVIRRVMDFSKPIEPRFILTDITRPIDDAVNLCRTTYRKCGITIENDILTNSLPPCYAEPHLIEEVILNLINNAADALKEIKTAKEIKITTKLAADTIQVSVSDSGPGLSQKVVHRIFEPFYTSKPNSTGIGLSLCQRIITDHGGTLVAGNSPLGGAEFIINIPAKPRLSGPGKEV
jgi:PAS domain S-box-containing protein